MDPGDVGFLSALWLGILTSISPCPLATNIAAVSYVGRHVGQPGTTLLAGLLYSTGRIVAYVVLGAAAVWSLMSVVAASSFLQGTFSRMLGPLLIVVGLLLLGVFSLNITGFGISEAMQRKVDRAGVWGALPLGAVLALAFCPVSAALFFGSLIPMATEQRSPIVMPAVYGLGTGLPVVIFSVFIALGAGWVGTAFDRLTGFEKWARRITAMVFIAVGVYETLRTTLYLI